MDTDYIYDINMNIYHSSIVRTPLSGGPQVGGQTETATHPEGPRFKSWPRYQTNKRVTGYFRDPFFYVCRNSAVESVIGAIFFGGY